MQNLPSEDHVDLRWIDFGSCRASTSLVRLSRLSLGLTSRAGCVTNARDFHHGPPRYRDGGYDLPVGEASAVRCGHAP